MKDECFLAIINLFHMADYHYEKSMELDKIASDHKNAETLEEKEKLEKRYNDCRTEHKMHDANTLANRYRLTVAFSRLLDKKFFQPSADKIACCLKEHFPDFIHTSVKHRRVFQKIQFYFFQFRYSIFRKILYTIFHRDTSFLCGCFFVNYIMAQKMGAPYYFF